MATPRTRRWLDEVEPRRAYLGPGEDAYGRLAESRERLELLADQYEALIRKGDRALPAFQEAAQVNGKMSLVQAVDECLFMIQYHKGMIAAAEERLSLMAQSTEGRRVFPPDNPWYWAEGGKVIPVKKIPTGTAMTERNPRWEQLWHLERLLREAVEWYEGMAARGEDALPEHMKSRGSESVTRLRIAQASAYSKIRELKGMVEEHRRALREARVPRPLVMFHE